MPTHLLLALHQLPHHCQQHCFELIPHEAVDEEVCRRIHYQEQVHETAESRLMRTKNGKDAPCQAKEPTRRHEAITPGFFCVRARILLVEAFLHSDALGPEELCTVYDQPGIIIFFLSLRLSELLSWSSLQRLFQIKLNLGK